MGAIVPTFATCHDPDLPLDMPDRSRTWQSRTSLTTAGEVPARLTHDGELRVRVHGCCHGLVSCEGQRLWTWGPFAHAFTVPVQSQPQAQPQPGSVTVRALGLLGVCRVRIELDPRAELREPRVASSTPPSPRPQPLALAAVPETPALKAALPLPGESR